MLKFRRNIRFVISLIFLGFAANTWAQDKITLWPSGAPLAKGKEDVDQPTLTVYPAPAANSSGTAIVVCPGGGYRHLAMGHEGEEIANWLNSIGISAFVLKYRIAPYQHPAPLLDAQRAIRTVRSRAGEWGIDPAKIGVLGFSAGGHLASTLATHFDDGDSKAADAIDRVGCRPDFAVLCYAVISFTDEAITHKGSITNLLGPEPSKEMLELLSNEKQVTSKTPPTFLWHTGEDKGVKPDNSVQFYLACVRAGVPAELHIYEKGPHGIGLGKKFPPAAQWVIQCEVWLKEHGLVGKKAS